MCASKGFVEQSLIEDEANILGDDIIKQYAKYNVDIKITKYWIAKGRFVFKVKIKGNTRETHIRAHAPDVQLKLKLPLFNVEKYDFTLYIITSRTKIEFPHLPTILCNPAYQEVWMQLPYVVGHNAIGDLRMIDLAEQPHLLFGGSSNSGKSVGLQALISSIAYNKPPSQVNFVLIDIGATDLMPFDGLPHLSCPVVRDRTDAMRTLTALTAEMDRRVNLEYTGPDSFKQLPRLIVVIDEFPALFTGVDKAVSKALTSDVSSLLQRGRHAKIHMVLAAQNPTFQNMKVDLGNITARIAFKCAKQNFSEVILGEGGAERLTAQGDLLMQASNYDGLQQIRGAYVTPDELGQLVQTIAAKWQGERANRLTITTSSTCSASERDSSISYGKIATQPSSADRLLAKVIVWAIGKDAVSARQIQRKYHLGWNKATELIKQLEAMGIVEQPMSKLPRHVVPIAFGDIPTEMREFLQHNGITDDAVKLAISARDDKPKELTAGQSHMILEEKLPTATQDLLQRNGFDVPQTNAEMRHTASPKCNAPHFTVSPEIRNHTMSPKRYRRRGQAV